LTLEIRLRLLAPSASLAAHRLRRVLRQLRKRGWDGDRSSCCSDDWSCSSCSVSPSQPENFLLRSLIGDSYRLRGKELDARPPARPPEIGW